MVASAFVFTTPGLAPKAGFGVYLMKHLFAVLAALALCACGPASQSSAPTTAPVTTGIEIRNAWASPTPGGVTVSAGYLSIINHTSAGDSLIGVTSDRASSVDVHTMSMTDGVMQMRSAGELPIPPGGTLTLAPSSLHLMFTNVTAPFAVGETIPVTLHFERGGDVDAALPVRAGAP